MDQIEIENTYVKESWNFLGKMIKFSHLGLVKNEIKEISWRVCVFKIVFNKGIRTSRTQGTIGPPMGKTNFLWLALQSYILRPRECIPAMAPPADQLTLSQPGGQIMPT